MALENCMTPSDYMCAQSIDLSFTVFYSAYIQWKDIKVLSFENELFITWIADLCDVTELCFIYKSRILKKYAVISLIHFYLLKSTSVRKSNSSSKT